MILLSSNQILNECLCRDRFNKFARISLLKKKNCDYNSSDRDQIRRAYLQKKKKNIKKKNNLSTSYKEEYKMF
jgi:hypothetical protein